MKKVLWFGIVVIVCTMLSTDCLSFTYEKEEQKVLDKYPTIGCKAAYIAEPATEKVIYEKNAHEKMYPASTTKILTALVVMENCELSDKVTISQHAVDLVPEDYSSAQLKAGEEFDVKTLLYALLIPSGNEAANALAEHVGGSIDGFVEMCNRRAQELGCEILHFTSPNGLHDENHYCSAYDLYLIAKECRQFEVFNEIVKTPVFTVPATTIYPKNDRTFENTNELLQSGDYYYANCTGIKTGHTSEAGECLVGSSQYQGLEFISVVMGGQEKNKQGWNERFYDTKQLFEFAYDHYRLQNIAEKGEIATVVTIEKATSKTAMLEGIVEETIETIVPKEFNKENRESSVVLYDNLVAPIEENQVIGTVTYRVDGLQYTTQLLASHAVEKKPYMIYNVIVISLILIAIVCCITYKANR